MADITNAEFRDALMEPLGEIKKFFDTKAAPHIEKINKIFDEGFKTTITRMDANIKQILDTLKKGSEEVKETQKEEKENATLIERAIKNSGGGSGGRGTGTGNGLGGAGAAGGNYNTGLKTGGITSGIITAFQGLGKELAPLGSIWGNLIKEETDYQTTMRDIAYQTQGITGDMRGLQSEFLKLGENAKITGVTMAELEHAFVNNLQKGVRTSRDELLKVTKTQLNLSTIIGDKNNMIAEDFRNWHVSMQLSNVQLQDIARGVESTAISSGVTGDNLAKVVQHTSQYVEKMRNAGTLTAEATKGVVELLAQAEKLGVTGKIDDILKATTDSYDLLFATDKKTQNMLYAAAARAGKLDQLRAGILTQTAEGREGLAQGMEKLFRDVTHGKSFADLSSMSAKQKARLEIMFKNAWGVGVDEAKRMVKALHESAKPLSDKLAEVKRKLSDQNISAEKRLQLEHERNKLIQNESTDFLTKWSEKADNAAEKGAVNFEEVSKAAFGNLDKNQIKSMQSMAENLGDVLGSEVKENVKKGIVDPSAALTISTLNAAKSLKDGGHAFIERYKKAQMTNDTKAMQDVIGDIGEEIQKQGIEEKRHLDPINDVAQWTKDTRDLLANYLKPFMPAIAAAMPILTWAAILGQGASMAEGIAKGVGDLMKLGSWGKGALGAGKAALGAGEGLAANAGKTALAGVGEYALAGEGTALAAGEGTALAAGEGATLAGIEGGTAATGIGVPIAAAIAIITAGIGGIVQSEESLTKANELFNTSTEKLTSTQKMAAESAGFFTGALNTLTFGLFSGALGPTGSLTKMMAQLYDAFPPLIAMAEMIMISFKVLWGVLKGLWYFIKEVFIGIWEGVKTAIEPLGELWNGISEALSPVKDAFNELFKALGLGGEGAGIVSTIATAFQYLGKAIGFVAKALGWVINFILTLFIKPFIAGFKMLVNFLMPVLKFAIGQIIHVINFFKGLFTILKGIFTLDPSTIWEGVKQAFTEFGKFILDALEAIFVTFPTWLGKKLVDGLEAVFITFPIWLGGKLIDGLKAMFVDFPIWLGKTMLDGLKAVFVDFPVWLYNKLCEALGNLVEWVKELIPGYKAAKEAAGNFTAGMEGKGTWGTARGAGEVVGGAADVFTGGKEGGVTGRLKGAGRAAWGVGETAVGLLGNIVGRGWLWGGGKKEDTAAAKEADKSTVELAQQATTPGSIYVHDIHLEEILNQLASRNALAGVIPGAGIIGDFIDKSPLGTLMSGMKGVGSMLASPIS